MDLQVVAKPTTYTPARKASRKAYQTRRKSRLRDWLKDYKKTLACEMCGAKRKKITFHRLDPSAKRMNVATATRRTMTFPTCKTCKHWNPPDEFSGVTVDPSCSRIPDLDDKKDGDKAFVSGPYKAVFHPSEDFGCILHSDFEAKDG